VEILYGSTNKIVFYLFWFDVQIVGPHQDGIQRRKKQNQHGTGGLRNANPNPLPQIQSRKRKAISLQSGHRQG